MTPPLFHLCLAVKTRGERVFPLAWALLLGCTTASSHSIRIGDIGHEPRETHFALRTENWTSVLAVPSVRPGSCYSPDIAPFGKLVALVYADAASREMRQPMGPDVPRGGIEILGTLRDLSGRETFETLLLSDPFWKGFHPSIQDMGAAGALVVFESGSQCHVRSIHADWRAGASIPPIPESKREFHRLIKARKVSGSEVQICTELRNTTHTIVLESCRIGGPAPSRQRVLTQEPNPGSHATDFLSLGNSRLLLAGAQWELRSTWERSEETGLVELSEMAEAEEPARTIAFELPDLRVASPFATPELNPWSFWSSQNGPRISATQEKMVVAWVAVRQSWESAVVCLSRDLSDESSANSVVLEEAGHEELSWVTCESVDDSGFAVAWRRRNENGLWSTKVALLRLDGTVATAAQEIPNSCSSVKGVLGLSVNLAIVGDRLFVTWASDDGIHLASVPFR